MKNYFSEEYIFFRDKLKFPFLALTLMTILVALISFIYFLENPASAVIEEGKLARGFQIEGLYDKAFSFSACINLFFFNLRTSIFVTALGLIPFLFLSASASINGYWIGLSLAGTKLKGMNLESFLLAILPHGLFELPAFLYASSLGIYLTIELSKKFIPSHKQKSTKPATLMRQICYSYILVIIPLLFLAAIMEEMVTARLIK